MHATFISACEKRAIKKTRAVLDSYAIRTGHTSWAAPMTMEGLKEIRAALKKTATRQTSVAAYINDGRRRMKLVWIVGSRFRFAADGAFPVGFTQKAQKQQLIPEWVRSASLLAGAAGDMHDIGKASVHFQNKLNPAQAMQRIADPVRHEWLSLKLLQRLRENGWQWQQAWQGIEKNIDHFTLSSRDFNKAPLKLLKTSLQNELEAVDYLVVTHHKLLAGDSDSPTAMPCNENHVRQLIKAGDTNISCAGDLPNSIFSSHQARIQRLARQTATIEEHDKLLFWKALAFHARAALIFADHTISALRYPNTQQKKYSLYANTKPTTDGQRIQDQPLEWHLQQVGDRAARVAVQIYSNLELTGLCEQTVEHIQRPASNTRFYWQNKSAQLLEKHTLKHPDIPSLILNIAATGSGKTRMNLRTACILRPHNPRIAITLNLRSLTLQTGQVLQHSMNLADDEIATIIGDTVSQKLFNATNNQQSQDEDENPVEPLFDAIGQESELPDWLNSLFTQHYQGRQVTDHQAKTILTAPLLVSTIDYLIAAGEPNQQGHHIKALLRLMSSDLILDEIDSYDPKALIAVLRLVQLAAMYGRHVICSSATVSYTVASKIHHAFQSGIEMRSALMRTPQSYRIGIIDNLLSAKLWINTACQPSLFQENYQQHLQQLQEQLSQQSKQVIYRLAQLQPVILEGLNPEQKIRTWQTAILEAVNQLHQQHSWQFGNTSKKISFGLIRVANIRPAIQLARFLSEHLPNAKIACYHANDWLINRHHKEQRLDFLLSRQKGNQHLLADEEIQQVVANSIHDDIPFIVIATPVEEVGRDHDFDWGIIDASSIQSIVQTAGRINRHRLQKITQPNIAILQFNYRYCANNKRQPVFKWPGYEGINGNMYASQDIAQLLPWNEHGQLLINATLRFNQQHCLFAKYDDQQIQDFCKTYFDDQLDDQDADQLFSHAQVEPAILTENPYRATPLRDMQKKQDYYFRFEDDEPKFYVKEQSPNQYGYIQLQDFDKILPIRPAPSNAWLYLSTGQMAERCVELGINLEEGCHTSLAVYQDDTPDWIYDEGFGLYKK
ncbi:type I-F CRISPR-associated helicase Cas3f [Alkanindiges sp. WGS2144]|uniref:type I-F CRISPR-associated helicase Cas3f n=1 Tax=Alkanindiges sp. WGS2144 TaxID=3366808 RepID=UPI0037516299